MSDFGSNESYFQQEKNKADAVQRIKKSRDLPQGFYEKAEGIVAPERLRDSEPHITINGSVDQEMFKDVSLTLEELRREKGVINKLNVSFSSFGGSVTTGFGIHDLIRVFSREEKAPVTITGYGPIMSMGALIIQAGDIRRMPKNSRMLLHPVSTSLWPDDVGRQEHRLAESKAVQRFYTEIVAERVQKAGKDIAAQDVHNLMYANDGVGTFLTSQQALELGLIDEAV